MGFTNARAKKRQASLITLGAGRNLVEAQGQTSGENLGLGTADLARLLTWRFEEYVRNRLSDRDRKTGKLFAQGSSAAGKKTHLKKRGRCTNRTLHGGGGGSGRRRGSVAKCGAKN